jgi:hypothetical protein
MAEGNRKIVEIYEEDGLEITRYADGRGDWVLRDVPSEVYEGLVQYAEEQRFSRWELAVQILLQGTVRDDGGMAREGS